MTVTGSGTWDSVLLLVGFIVVIAISQKWLSDKQGLKYKATLKKYEDLTKKEQ